MLELGEGIRACAKSESDPWVRKDFDVIFNFQNVPFLSLELIHHLDLSQIFAAYEIHHIFLHQCNSTVYLSKSVIDWVTLLFIFIVWLSKKFVTSESILFCISGNQDIKTFILLRELISFPFFQSSCPVSSVSLSPQIMFVSKFYQKPKPKTNMNHRGDQKEEKQQQRGKISYNSNNNKNKKRNKPKGIVPPS